MAISHKLAFLCHLLSAAYTAWKVSKCGVFSGPYFPVFSPNKGKYGPEKTLYLDTIPTVLLSLSLFTRYSKISNVLSLVSTMV